MTDVVHFAKVYEAHSVAEFFIALLADEQEQPFAVFFVLDIFQTFTGVWSCAVL